MAFTIPDSGDGDSLIQSIFFREYLEVLIAGISGVDCVLSGLAVTGGSDMTPAVAKGAVLTNGILKAVAAADVTIGTAHATHPRIDLIVVTSSGSLAVRAGTAAAAPQPPTRTANDVAIAAVYVPANDTTIAQSQITDLRVTPSLPLTIYRTTTAETTNTTAAAIHMLDKTNSGVAIPNGLLATGRMLHVRIWGNVLLNSGTPTMTLAIALGGVTMFSDVSAAAAADADRRPFVLEFDIVAQGNADQAMNVRMMMSDWAAVITGPATGIGDLWGGAGTNETNQVGGGAGTADMDTADRTLTSTLTFSVSNAANELVVEGAFVDLR